MCSSSYLQFMPKVRECCPEGAKPFVRPFVHREWDLKSDSSARTKFGDIPPQMLPSGSAKILAGNGAFSKWDKCAIIGNSGHLLKSKWGAEIDKNDVVMRINQAPTKGYEKYVGKRTTHRLLNRLWTLAYGESKELSNIYRRPDVRAVQVEHIRLTPPRVESTLVFQLLESTSPSNPVGFKCQPAPPPTPRGGRWRRT